jgi:AraC family transcriptional regulator, melibiose operon regulatory protein
MVQLPQDHFVDESVPAHPDDPWRSPVVIFGDHGLCAGVSRRVQRMPRPHMHSQIELNYVLQGSMTYRVDERDVVVNAGRLTMFWGMVPHQVVALTEPTFFVCLYAPMPIFLGLPTSGGLREAIFSGGVIEADVNHGYDRDIVQRWQEELLSEDRMTADIVRDELSARIRRIDRDGWHDLRQQSRLLAHVSRNDNDGIVHVERMARYIGEHAHEEISVECVARTADLHPNYAMTLYKRLTGTTINQSIIRQRLDLAQSMLIASEETVARIAYDCGFGSLSSFYTAFVKRFHLTPLNFRRAYAVRN